MKGLVKMDKFFKAFIMIFILILSVCCWFSGCKYGSIVSIGEQIAIYQNKGFVKIEDPQTSTVVNNIELKINSKKQINDYFLINNIDCKIDTLCLIYLPKNANCISSLIYIYTFTDHKTAQIFFSNFQPNFKNSMHLHNNYVIQKGISTHISNGAENYKYFIDFCNGLK